MTAVLGPNSLNLGRNESVVMRDGSERFQWYVQELASFTIRLGWYTTKWERGCVLVASVLLLSPCEARFWRRRHEILEP